jgi:hypothetical protein
MANAPKTSTSPLVLLGIIRMPGRKARVIYKPFLMDFPDYPLAIHLPDSNPRPWLPPLS